MCDVIATRPFHFVHTARVLQRERKMLASTCLYSLYAWFYVRQKASCSFVPSLHQILATPLTAESHGVCVNAVYSSTSSVRRSSSISLHQPRTAWMTSDTPTFHPDASPAPAVRTSQLSTNCSKAPVANRTPKVPRTVVGRQGWIWECADCSTASFSGRPG